jgi:predicted AlkP superfamily phosphohydrolase/phosphomutase
MQATTFYVNSLHHYLWDHEYTLRGWQKIDEHIGKFVEDDINVILMSDHGSTEIDSVFHINTWLEKEGYLELDTTAAEYVYKLGINRDRILQVASWLGLQDLAKRLAPESLLRYIPDSQGELSHESKTDNIDWKATTAVASGQGPVYVTANGSKTAASTWMKPPI